MKTNIKQQFKLDVQKFGLIISLIIFPIRYIMLDEI